MKKYSTSYELQQAYYRHEVTQGEYLEILKKIIETFSPGKYTGEQKEVRAVQGFAAMIKTHGMRAGE